jgi:hypothetical protein
VIPVGDEVKVDGLTLLNYKQRITDIMTLIQEVEQEAKTASDAVLGDMYLGKAADELKMFYSSYYAHVQRLLLFYYKSTQYLDYTFQQVQYTDDELADIITRYLNGGGR